MCDFFDLFVYLTVDKKQLPQMRINTKASHTRIGHFNNCHFHYLAGQTVLHCSENCFGNGNLCFLSKGPSYQYHLHWSFILNLDRDGKSTFLLTIDTQGEVVMDVDNEEESEGELEQRVASNSAKGPRMNCK